MPMPTGRLRDRVEIAEELVADEHPAGDATQLAHDVGRHDMADAPSPVAFGGAAQQGDRRGLVGIADRCLHEESV